MTAKVDFVVGFCLILLAVGIYYMTTQMPQKEAGLGPGDYPRVIVYGFGLLGSILSITSFSKLRKKKEDKEKKFEKGEILQVAYLVTCVALYLFILPYIGFIFLTPALMFTMMFIFGLRKWILMGIISVVTTIFVYILFDRFLLVLLPEFSLF